MHQNQQRISIREESLRLLTMHRKKMKKLQNMPHTTMLTKQEEKAHTVQPHLRERRSGKDVKKKKKKLREVVLNKKKKKKKKNNIKSMKNKMDLVVFSSDDQEIDG